MAERGNVYVLPVEVFDSRSEGVTAWKWKICAIIEDSKVYAALSIMKNLGRNSRIPEKKLTKSCLDAHPYATETGVLVPFKPF